MIELPYLVRRSASDQPVLHKMWVREDVICRIEESPYGADHTHVWLDKSEKPLLCPLTMEDWEEVLTGPEGEEEAECTPVG